MKAAVRGIEVDVEAEAEAEVHVHVHVDLAGMNVRVEHLPTCELIAARNLLGESQFGVKSGALALVYLAGSASAPFLGSLVWGRGGYDLVLPGLVVLAGIGLLLYNLAHLTVQKKQPE